MPKKLNLETTIKHFKEMHGDLYDYSKFIYVNAMHRSIIICKLHGEFIQCARDHKTGSHCPKCSNIIIGNKSKLTIGENIEKFQKIHKDRYDYSKFILVNDKTHGIVICKTHGEFKITPSQHKQGGGCPLCSYSKGEVAITNYFKDHQITFLPQHRFNRCRGNKFPLPFDFYLPQYNIVIEYHGEQHYKAIDYFGGESRFKYIQHNDEIKRNYCILNNIPLVVIKYSRNIKEILSNVAQLDYFISNPINS